MRIAPIDYAALQSAANQNIPRVPVTADDPQMLGSPALGMAVSELSRLFGSAGPLSNLTLSGIHAGGGKLTLDVQGAWRPQVKAHVKGVAQRLIHDQAHLAGWNIAVTDSSNLEQPMAQMQRSKS
ncbi:MAG: hypothetical protein AAFQ82_02760 [Myxococcota bacterium]